MILVFALIGLFGFLLVYSILTYNRFVSLNNRVINSWAQINVQLKKRSDLIPKLVQIVKGYSKYEKETLKEITELRSSINTARSVNKKYELNKKIGKMVDKFFVIAENYPSLKANKNFLQLQEELSDVEDKIAFTRQFYNDTVYKYNNLLQSFPSSIIGKLMKLDKKESFNQKVDYEGVKF